MIPTLVSDPLLLPDVGGLSVMRDDELMGLQARISAIRRRVDAASAAVAGELSRRSARELGLRGLAQRTGARTAERLVSNLTGMSVHEARAMVAVGEAMGDGSSWLTPVTDRVVAGELSVGAAAAIRSGLGEPTDEVDADELARAAALLAAQSTGLAPETAGQRAREVRDELDEAGIADREAALRDKRYLRLTRLGGGMTRITGLLDPESAALVTDAFDRVTAPRRGGVRFVDPAEKARAEAIVADVRSTDQVTVDAFVRMVQVAGEADGGAIFGRTAPSIRVHVTLDSLRRGIGAGFAEGQTEPLSIGTVQRLVCAGGVVPILFDEDGKCLNVGRAQRLFTPKQRIAIAARDGGCVVGGCGRPPAWTEAHHADEWDAHEGKTDVDNGISLCRHHHMWLHDGGGRIVLVGTDYQLQMPGEAPVVLRSKSRIAHRRQIA
ncbi:hypothetical protein BH09ACT4_BH09ACT4_20250 [soil metagenome]